MKAEDIAEFVRLVNEVKKAVEIFTKLVPIGLDEKDYTIEQKEASENFLEACKKMLIFRENHPPDY